MELAIGIDLGNSYSSVAVVKAGSAAVMPDDEGFLTIPSVVSFPREGGVLVGYKARERLVTDPFHTVYSAKRLIGRRIDDPDARMAISSYPYAVVEGPSGHPVVEVRGEQISIPEISAYVLRRMKKIAEAYLGTTVDKAVITVPANFNDSQRESTRIAGRIAGLEVIRIINEPTAVALAHAHGKGRERTVAVYDFGGGSFDFTVLRIERKVTRVLSTAGDIFLGGDDFDEALASAVANSFWKQTGIELRNDVVEWQRLLFAAEELKRKLSSKNEDMLRLARVAHTATGTLDLSARVTRKLFKSLCTELVRRSFGVCDRALQDVGLSPQQVDEVILAGGTTYIPLVRASVKQYFGTAPRTDINPETAVAMGAAIQAGALMSTPQVTSSQENVVLLDVLPHSIGIVTADGYTERVLERNMPIPVEQSRIFSTSKANQAELRVRIAQGESEREEDNTPLGELVIGGLKPAARGAIKILVTFEVDESGILSVTAREPGSGKVFKRTVKISAELDEERIEAIQLRGDFL